MNSECYLLPVGWVKIVLNLIAFTGSAFGLFSFLFPSRSISLYVSIMKAFQWRVEPLFPEREVRNTRWLGLAMLFLSVLMAVLI